MKISFSATLLLILLLTSGCADLSYYLHSVKGQVSIMLKTQDIEDILDDSETDMQLRRQLELVAGIRQFAFEELHLPQSDSYTQYADLGRRFVLKNLFASAEFSIQLHRWCYPVVGCAGYRGFFDENRLLRYKTRLQRQGMDVYVANVPAYSTLGWFDDPVLNTFINWPEYRLAGLIFHELAHQRLYIDDDSQFNESFAMAVQQTGVEKWLLASDQLAELKRYQQYLKNRQQVVELIEQGRNQLKKLYAQEIPGEQKRTRKKRLLDDLKLSYQQLTEKFAVADGFKYWFESNLNNAKLASVSTYHTRVGAFRALLLKLDGNYPAFYRQVEKTGKLEKTLRHQCLDDWADINFRSEICQ